MTTCAHLASRGVGVTALPTAVVAHFLSTNLLMRLEISERFNPWHVVAVSRKVGRTEALTLAWVCVAEAVSTFQNSSAGQFLESKVAAAA
jgi:DNA-binding transcriptional LysR family regulator